jgi:hypothetical protein
VYQTAFLFYKRRIAQNQITGSQFWPQPTAPAEEPYLAWRLCFEARQNIFCQVGPHAWLEDE